MRLAASGKRNENRIAPTAAGDMGSGEQEGHIMRRGIVVLGVLAMSAWALAAAHEAWAFPKVALETGVSCVTCHTNPAGGAKLTDAGAAFKKDGTKPKMSDATAAEYVGAEKCKMCHSKQYKSWAETPHASAMKVLEEGKAEAIQAMAKALDVKLEGKASASEDCVACHVTGFKLAGGYPQKEEAAMASVSKVGCENCHGPGSLHLKAKMAEKKNFINGAVTENMCTQCHTKATSPKFDFATFKGKVHEMKAAEKSE
jgi:hypothetical protein